MLVVGWAMLADFSAHLPRFLRRVAPVEPANFPWDKPKYYKEKCVKDVGYYARQAGEGYEIVDEEVETEDGFYLRYVHAGCGEDNRFPEVSSQGCTES